jgi:hypothetical protein
MQQKIVAQHFRKPLEQRANYPARICGILRYI